MSTPIELKRWTVAVIVVSALKEAGHHYLHWAYQQARSHHED